MCQVRGDAQIIKLIRRAQKIVDYPLVGRMVREYEDNAIREVLERPYRIIYQINDETIVILTVMHYRQLLPADIHELSKKR